MATSRVILPSYMTQHEVYSDQEALATERYTVSGLFFLFLIYYYFIHLLSGSEAWMCGFCFVI